MRVSELFESSVLLEKLGNLANLKVGSMINILRQREENRGGYKRSQSYSVAGPAGKAFNGGEYRSSYGTAGFGHDSEIVDAGVIKGGIGGLRKAYRDHGDKEPIAFALYVDGKAVCFGRFDEEALRGTARTGIFAFDLSQFKDQLAKAGQEKYDSMSDYQKRSNKPENFAPKSSSYSEKELSDWNKERAKEAGKKIAPEKYHGELTSTASLKEFLEELVGYAGSKPITCKLVMKDTAGLKKQGERSSARMSDDQLQAGLEGLKKRLINYKISKKPTIDNIHDFLKQALEGKNKVVQFAGRGWSTKAENGYSDINPLSIINGTPFNISYKCVDAGSHDSLKVYYVFDKDTGILAPYKATWTGKNYEHAEASIKHDTYMKKEFNADLGDKDSVIKAILMKVKDNNLNAAQRGIDASRAAGHDYPEFASIEKSIKAQK